MKSRQLNLKIILIFELLLWVLHAVAYSFYLRYIGHVPLTIFLVFKITLISLVPPLVNLISYDFRDLRERLHRARSNNRELADIADDLSGEEDHAIELKSESLSERLNLDLRSLIMIRSADNYVEVHYREDGLLRKKLLRTTLRKIESQLRIYAVMVRCHRNCIVNISHVDELKRTAQGARLVMKGLEEDLAVSRQYLLGVKSALSLS